MTEATMGFVGVDTARSSIMRVFPVWAEILDLPARRLQGYDVALDADDRRYRELVREIADEDACSGALVTTHKLRIYEAAADLFDEIDELAQRYGEISSISKRDGRLVGSAKDPITARLAIEDFLPAGYFAGSPAEVVCIGAGGAGAAITAVLGGRADPPERIVAVDIEPTRLDHLRDVHERAGLDPSRCEYVHAGDVARTGEAVEGAAPGSLVINASGVGKDLPGSPVPAGVAFPMDGYVWEINYRGGLELLESARRQAEARRLTVVDGWRYFAHGWTQVIAEVFDIEMPPERVERLARAAEFVR